MLVWRKAALQVLALCATLGLWADDPVARIGLREGGEDVGGVIAGMAPFTVHVDALDSTVGEGDWLTLRADWDFGAESGSGDQLPGWGGAYTYDAAGTYTITLRLENEAGGIDLATRTVEVSADTRRRIFVSPQGDESADGTSPETAIRSVARIHELLADDTAILFEAGTTHDFSTTQLRLNGVSNVLVGRYGEGAPPVLLGPEHSPAGATTLILMESSFGDPAGVSRVVVQDLEFRTPSAASLATEHNHNAIGMMGAEADNLTIRRCFFENVGYCIVTDSGDWPRGVCEFRYPMGILVEDNIATRTSDYFIFSNTQNTTLRGNLVTEGSPSQWVFRMYADRVFIHENDFQLSIGNIEEYALAGGPHCETDFDQQLCDCEAETGNLKWGEFAYLANNQLDGTLRLGYEYRDSYYRWIVLEGNRWGREASNQSPTPTLRHFKFSDHIMVRNNRFFGPFGSASFTGQGVTDIRFLHNTGIDTRNEHSFLNVYLPPSATDTFKLVGNLWVSPGYIPNRWGGYPYVFSTPTADLSGFAFARNVWPARQSEDYGWEFFAGGDVLAEDWASASGAEGDWILTTPIEALDWEASPVATDVPWRASFAPTPGVWSDAFGEPRPAAGNWTAGAIEPEGEISVDWPFAEIVAFGDSYTDTGRDGGFVNTNDPPGAVWIDVLAGSLQLPAPGAYRPGVDESGRNFAHGGATAGLATDLPDGPEQLDDYLFTVLNGASVPADALVVVWLGGNDIFQGSTPDEAAAATAALLRRLIAAGARHVLTGNNVPFGLMPANQGSAALWTGRAANFRGHMADEVARLRRDFPAVTITAFDAFSLFQRIAANPSLYGLENASEPARDTSGGDFETWLWWDSVHPTTAGHALIADFALAALETTYAGPESEGVNGADYVLRWIASGGGWQLQLEGPPTASVTVWHSPDLTTWTAHETLNDFFGTALLTDDVAPEGFYRVQSGEGRNAE
jgi:phospholipase/lecithinase/hemolysin